MNDLAPLAPIRRRARMDRGATGGGAAREGRQHAMLHQVELWRRLDRAVGGGAVTLGPVRIGHRDLLRAVAIDGLSVSQLLAALGLPRSRVHRLALLAGVIATAIALAVELGHIEPVEKRSHGSKKPVDDRLRNAAGDKGSCDQCARRQGQAD